MFPFQFLFDRQKSERKIKDNPHIVSRSEGPRSSRARVDYPLSGRLLGLNELLYRDYSRGWRWHCCPISQIQIRDALHQHPPQLLRNHLKYIDNTIWGRVGFQWKINMSHSMYEYSKSRGINVNIIRLC